MYRYIAIVWNARVPKQQALASLIIDHLGARAQQWNCAFRGLGVAVFHAGERLKRMQAYVLPNNGGAVLGKLFRRGTPQTPSISVTTLDEQEGRRIRETTGKRLMDHYWGRYVAFIGDSAAKTLHVLRDPTGALPCMRTEYEGIRIIFSDVEDCSREISWLHFSINWKHIAARLTFLPIQTNETGLNEVYELLPGECLDFSSSRCHRRFHWHPADIARSDAVEDPVTAAQELRRVALDCITAWASCYRSVIHTLSGGIDSALVLGCLQWAPRPPKITCLNYFTPTPTGDERRFARAAAARPGHLLVEKELDGTRVRLENLSTIAQSARPAEYLHGLDRGAIETELAEEFRAETIFSGCGGSAILSQPRPVFGAVDYVWRHGVRLALFRIAIEAARLTGIPIWSVLHAALCDRLSRCNRSRYEDEAVRKVNIAFIRPDIFDRIADISHPWLAARADIPPGKALQILAVCAPPLYYDMFNRISPIERTHPLMSQPIIELCLRIPSYVLSTGGKDRGLARLAFAGDLPAEICNRCSKGSTYVYCKDVVKRNRAFIRDFLLGGVLTREKFLDPVRLSSLMTDDQTNIHENNRQLLDAVNVEAWLRRWCVA